MLFCHNTQLPCTQLAKCPVADTSWKAIPHGRVSSPIGPAPTLASVASFCRSKNICTNFSLTTLTCYNLHLTILRAGELKPWLCTEQVYVPNMYVPNMTLARNCSRYVLSVRLVSRPSILTDLGTSADPLLYNGSPSSREGSASTHQGVSSAAHMQVGAAFLLFFG